MEQLRIMPEENLETPGTRTIVLPPLEIKTRAFAVGKLRHVVDEGGLREVLKIGEAQVSPRCREPLYVLSDGQRIIVTSKLGVMRPHDADGVLFESDDSKFRWLSHRKLDEFEGRAAEIGIAAMARKISESWNGRFKYIPEEENDGQVTQAGLRPAQIGALHAIGAHWSLFRNPATVVMPTGTGKTETMLGSRVIYPRGLMLVVVPSSVLRDQTAAKFLVLGLLRKLGVLEKEATNPIVGIVKNRLKAEEDLEFFRSCNVAIGTMSALGDGTSAEFLRSLSKEVAILVVDEAHHIGAPTWSRFRDETLSSRILQFTATPFRRDGKLVDGRVIFEYPLAIAQIDGYFKKIHFHSVFELDEEQGDVAIAKLAATKLHGDLEAGFDHLVMARCDNIAHAKAIHLLYQAIAPEFAPVLVHSEAEHTSAALDAIRSGASKIVVCVNMLGEGFDLPQLKIAALHDTHKSLAVILQFIGRFTRSAATNLGDASVYANIADENVSNALEKLYSEDADWNQLLQEYSSEASRLHKEFMEFLENSRRLREDSEEEVLEISPRLLRPTLSTLVYRAKDFNYHEFFRAFASGVEIIAEWYHAESETLYFLTKTTPSVKWSQAQSIREEHWDLFVLHFDRAKGLLFLCSSDNSVHEELAVAVGAESMISGETVFRVLGRINRLSFQSVGVKKIASLAVSFAQYMGSNVKEGLSDSEKINSIKSNLSGTGWENGELISIGCSHKGRIWARAQGHIPEFVEWCSSIGEKLLDDSIDPAEVFEHALVPVVVDKLPDRIPLSVEWPFEILRRAESTIKFSKTDQELQLFKADLKIANYDPVAGEIIFQIVAEDEAWAEVKLIIGNDPRGYTVSLTGDDHINIRVGHYTVTLEKYFQANPPIVRFVDLSQLEGCLFVEPKVDFDPAFPSDRIDVWDWQGIDITKESIWKNGIRRVDSIQARAAAGYVEGGFQVVFDDDASGEAADLICLKEEEEQIRMVLVHCKFSAGAAAGARVEDVVVACSQAVRCAKWKWKFRDLCQHIRRRERDLTGGNRTTRFLAGDPSLVNHLASRSRFKRIAPEVVIVQPGLSKERMSADQSYVLSAAASYLKQTMAADLDLIASA